MKNLEFTRIDDRLIHGQVVAAWLHAYGKVQHIIVIDDKTRQDPFMQEMFSLLVPSGITIEILSVAEAIESLRSGLGKPTMIIVKVPQTIQSLVNAGIDINFVNIGGMGMTPGRKKFFQNVSTSPEENEILKQLISKGIKVEIQIIPAQKKVDVASLLK
ncbi:MAG: PTS sugar transporter subunit IIB [Eubacteriales bacterium]|nr:PTS sugar transporter subunit IIB [Eubacteriales bacterium]